MSRPTVLAPAARALRRAVGTAAAAVLVLAGLSPASAVAASEKERTAGDRQVTAYALRGNAYGTTVRSRTVPAESGRTAYSWVSCTAVAGVERANSLVRADLTDGAFAAGIDTSTRTSRVDGVVSVLSRSDVDRLAVGNDVGSLDIRGLRVRSRAWHDADGFHRSGSATVAALSAQVGGQPVPVPVPGEIEAGDSLSVPGVAEVTFFDLRGQRSNDGARSISLGLRVDLADGSTLTAGRTNAQIDGDVVAGLMRGPATALEADTLDEVLTSGKIARQPLDCRGTDGRHVTNATTAARVPGVLALGAATATAWGDHTAARRADAHTQAYVSRLSLGDGGLVVREVQAQANTVREGDRYQRTAQGSSVGSLVLDGEVVELPRPGASLRIAGVGTVTSQLVTRGRYGITVVGLRIELLDASPLGTTIDVATASSSVRPRSLG